jgi:hypothetical protein
LKYQSLVSNYQSLVLHYKTLVLNYPGSVLQYQSLVLKYQSLVMKDQRLVLQHQGDARSDIDAAYQTIFKSTHKHATRTTYLVAGKIEITIGPAARCALAADVTMQASLVRRWRECHVCIVAGAHLAATVMMGGLLEALCVARVNKMPDKSPLFKAKSTPLDSKTGKPLQLSEWTLRPYLDVAHEIGLLTRSGKDVGAVLRDDRNYIHPQKEYSHSVVLGPHDAVMFWDLTKNLVRQILAS